eukprot:3038934-Prymnesium_polylepis.2
MLHGRLSAFWYPANQEYQAEVLRESYEEWCTSSGAEAAAKYSGDGRKDEDGASKLYAGERAVLEDVLRAGGGRLLTDFKPIPQSASCEATTFRTLHELYSWHDANRARIGLADAM